jgi:hypothetical protein
MGARQRPRRKKECLSCSCKSCNKVELCNKIEKIKKECLEKRRI